MALGAMPGCVVTYWRVHELSSITQLKTMTNLLERQSQLIKAIKQEDHITLVKILSGAQSVNPNLKTEYGFPIKEATFSNCTTQTLRLLLDAGADPNPPGCMSPLQRCISNKNLEAVKLLVKRGANINHQDSNKSTPLHTSIFYHDPYITKFLLNCGANVEAESEFGQTPFHTLIGMTQGSIGACNMLIDAGADLNHSDSSGYTPLHLAVCKGKIYIVVLLLERGANPLAITGSGDTALHLACQHKNIEIVELLIKVGIPIESRNHVMFTPLHTAVYHQCAPIVFNLIKAGANVNTLNVTGRRPVYIAAPRQDMQCLNILLTAGSTVSQELCQVECLKHQVSVADKSNPMGAYMEHLSLHPRSLQEICMLTIRKILAPHLQIKVHHLPVPHAFQKEIALESLTFENLSDLSKFRLEK